MRIYFWKCPVTMESIHISPVRATSARLPLRQAVPIHFAQEPVAPAWQSDQVVLSSSVRSQTVEADMGALLNLPAGFLAVRAIGISGVGGGGTGPIQQANLYQLMRLLPKLDADVGVGFEKRADKTMNKTNAGVRYYLHQDDTWAPYVGAGATYASSHVLRHDPAELGGYIKVGTEYFLDRQWALDAAVVGQSLFGLAGQGSRHTVGASVGLNYHFDR